MLISAMEYLSDLTEAATNKVINEGGRKFWSRTGTEIKPHTANTLVEVPTLDGLLSVLDSLEMVRHVIETGKVEYVKDGSTQIIVERNVQIVVSSPTIVSVVTSPDPKYATRETIIKASYNVNPFPFGRYLDIEEFIIRAQCGIVGSDVKRDMLAFVSSITGEQVQTNTDDGVSQTVVKEDRLGRKERASFNPILSLAPRRTFPEIQQPISEFLLRMQKGRDRPEVALFEADGGLWKVLAVNKISEYLRADKRVQDLGIKVIG